MERQIEIVRLRDDQVIGRIALTRDIGWAVEGALSPDGSELYWFNDRGTVFKSEPDPERPGHYSTRALFQVSPFLTDSRAFCMKALNPATGQVLSWDESRRQIIVHEADGHESWSFSIPHSWQLVGEDGDITYDRPVVMKFLADGRHVTCSSFSFTMLIDVGARRIVYERCPKNPADRMAFSHEGRWLALATPHNSGRIELWDLWPGRRWRNHLLSFAALVAFACCWGWDQKRRRVSSTGDDKPIGVAFHWAGWFVIGMLPLFSLIAGLFAVSLRWQGGTIPLNSAWPLAVFATLVMASHLIAESGALWALKKQARQSTSSERTETACEPRSPTPPPALLWHQRLLILGGVAKLWLVLPMALPVMSWSPLLAILARLNREVAFADPPAFSAFDLLLSLLIGLGGLRLIAAGMGQASWPALEHPRRQQRWSLLHFDIINGALSGLERWLVPRTK